MICGDQLTAVEMIGDGPVDLIAGCDVSGPGAGKWRDESALSGLNPR